MEQLSGPGDTDRTDAWVVIHTSFLIRILFQLYQRNVIRIGSGIIAAEVSEYNGHCLSELLNVVQMDAWMDDSVDTWGGYGFPELVQCLWCSEFLTSSTGKT